MILAESSVYNREDYANISDSVPPAIFKLVDNEESLFLEQLGIKKDKKGY